MANASDEGATERETVLAVLQDDIRHVHVRITAAIGIAAVFVTQIDLDTLRAEPGGLRWATFLGVLALFVSAALYFQYTQQLNKLRLRIAAEAVVGSHDALDAWRSQFVDDEETKKSLRKTGKRPKVWLFKGGQVFLLVGLVCVTLVLWDLIVGA